MEGNARYGAGLIQKMEGNARFGAGFAQNLAVFNLFWRVQIRFLWCLFRFLWVIIGMQKGTNRLRQVRICTLGILIKCSGFMKL